MEPIGTKATKAEVVERLGWERMHWAKFRDYTKSEAEKIASFDEGLWEGVAKRDMKTYTDVPKVIMENARRNVNIQLVNHEGLAPVDRDVFDWRMKQALYYELNRRRDASASNSEASKYYDPVKEST